jgi:hypothetical protein
MKAEPEVTEEHPVQKILRLVLDEPTDREWKAKKVSEVLLDFTSRREAAALRLNESLQRQLDVIDEVLDWVGKDMGRMDGLRAALLKAAEEGARRMQDAAWGAAYHAQDLKGAYRGVRECASPEEIAREVVDGK